MSPGGGGGGAIHPPAFVPLQVDHDHIPGACGVNYYCIVFVLYLYWVAVAHGVHSGLHLGGGEQGIWPPLGQGLPPLGF